VGCAEQVQRVQEKKTPDLAIYAQLSKARLSSLVVLSSSAGFLLAGAPVAVDSLVGVSLGTAMCAAAANTFNQVYERNTDKLMKRTCARPLPAGKISRMHALTFGAVNAVAGTAVLGITCNPLTAGLGAANVALYALVYTPMKRISTWNTWVGAIVGGIPPLMGYAAATGTVASAEAAILGAGLFLWQFPHFFSLAWLSKRDYAAGGHKMIPCFDKTGASTAKLLTRYSMALSSLPLMSYSLGITSAMFPLESILFNGYLLYGAQRFKENPSMGNARRVFRASLWYLPVFMFLMVFHKNEWADPSGRSPYLAFNGINPKIAHDSREEVVEIERISNEAVTLERLLRCAKARMRELCLHEIVVPPLSRKMALLEESIEKESPLCPVTQATKLMRSGTQSK